MVLFWAKAVHPSLTRTLHCILGPFEPVNDSLSDVSCVFDLLDVGAAYLGLIFTTCAVLVGESYLPILSFVFLILLGIDQIV